MTITNYTPTKIDLEIALALLPEKKKIKTLLGIVHSEWSRELAVASLEKAKEIVLHDKNHDHYKAGYKMAFYDVDKRLGDEWISIEIRA